ncbi:hypothetical protein MNBD_GAMMA12-3349 [hydrothermal vent metagenome]|uniref:Phosphonate ABC transporter phosphate-binding periplasmic component (TC 3.A.1.9.1) n=1 Tax=hydrothermal vent metagenome TaxID=652676 RepID=A0A3B0YAS2_9ZZZZ
MPRENIKMKIILRILLIVPVLLLISQVSFTEQSNGIHKPLIVGVFPRRNATSTYKLFKPMAKYLSLKLGRKVTLLTAKDFKTFWHNVKAKKYDLVHYNQYHYILSNQQWGYKVIAKNEEFGQDYIAPAIVVRRNSKVQKVEDLRGKKIMFGGGPKAMIAYIYARHLLQEAGLNPGDYTQAFAKNPVNAVLSTYFNQSDASAAGNLILRLPVVKKQINVSKLRYLVIGKAYAHIPWATSPNISKSLSHKIQQVLVNLEKSAQGRRVLKSAKLTGLKLTYDKEFDPYRAIIKKVLQQ